MAYGLGSRVKRFTTGLGLRVSGLALQKIHCFPMEHPNKDARSLGCYTVDARLPVCSLRVLDEKHTNSTI